MVQQRQSMFAGARAAPRQAPQRSGVFGSNVRAPNNKSSYGLQKARQAPQGRSLGGRRMPFSRQPANANPNRRRQMFSGRLGPQPNKRAFGANPNARFNRPQASSAPISPRTVYAELQDPALRRY